MTILCSEDLGAGIYCIDTEQYRPNMAACYLVHQGNAVALIDTGTHYSVPNVLATLNNIGLNTHHVQYIIPTHAHLDHAGGAGALMQLCPNATLMAHPRTVVHMIDPSRLQKGVEAVYGTDGFKQNYHELIPVPPARVQEAGHSTRIDLNGRILQVLETAGHASHHICLFDQSTRGCFAGDTFGIAYPEFINEKGAWLFAPTTPVDFNPEAWHASLDNIMVLQPSAVYLTHYGKHTAVTDLAQQLRGSIDQLSHIALAVQNIPVAERKDAIKQQIMQSFLANLADHGCRRSASEIQSLLAVDIELNAQGLDVWLARRAKTAQQA